MTTRPNYYGPIPFAIGRNLVVVIFGGSLQIYSVLAGGFIDEEDDAATLANCKVACEDPGNKGSYRFILPDALNTNQNYHGILYDANETTFENSLYQFEIQSTVIQQSVTIPSGGDSGLTVQQVVDSIRIKAHDTVYPFRLTDDECIVATNKACNTALHDRPDLGFGVISGPYHATELTQNVPFAYGDLDALAAKGYELVETDQVTKTADSLMKNEQIYRSHFLGQRGGTPAPKSRQRAV